MNICKRCQVSGRVQGVSYRYATKMKAQALAVSGYVTNLDDGSVEVLVCGELEAVSRLCRWLSQGPALAQVSRVQCEDHDLIEADGFTIK